MLCMSVSRCLIFFLCWFSCLPIFDVRGSTESNTSTANCAWLPGKSLRHFTALYRLLSSTANGFATDRWRNITLEFRMTKAGAPQVFWDVGFCHKLKLGHMTLPLKPLIRYCYLLHVTASRLPLSRELKYYRRSVVTSWLSRLFCQEAANWVLKYDFLF